MSDFNATDFGSNSTNSTADGGVEVNGVGALPFTPLLVPALIFSIVYAVLMFLQLIVAANFWRYFGNAIGMICGLLLELLGYVAKVMLSHNRFNKNGYIMYIIGLTLGPTFLSSALYLSISALMRRHTLARFRFLGPRAFSTLFILGDFLCLCFIGVGGSLAAIYADQPIGVDLMIAGLGTQILFTSIFCIVLACLYHRLHKRSVMSLDKKTVQYGYLLGIAAACLFIRSCWRAAELSGGFNGPLASKEGVFIALDSIPILIMSVLLIVLHPGFWFRKKKIQYELELASRCSPDTLTKMDRV
ncbi:hypothetical protein SEUCBS140593_007880 [Sporothrix eucalyptigena]|uniref:RTA1 domain protein n=1 Tax=Sporothrix eucalyptigena TaxID=1812306 RepID=A0ABP0CJP7_9PEZI